MLTRLVKLAVAAVLFSGLLRGAPAAAQSGDTIDGAIWVFEMKAKGPRGDMLRGRFRVSDHVLYQQSERSRTAPFDKVIGKNHPGDRRTRIEFEDFRASNGEKVQGGLKGTARLKIERFGEWSGIFTDGEGRNWDVKCTRVRE